MLIVLVCLVKELARRDTQRILYAVVVAWYSSFVTWKVNLPILNVLSFKCGKMEGIPSRNHDVLKVRSMVSHTSIDLYWLVVSYSDSRGLRQTSYTYLLPLSSQMEHASEYIAMFMTQR